MKMKTKYFFVLLVAFIMGTQVMSAQHHENGKRPSRKRMTIEQMTDMQANKIIGDLGLDDKTAAKFKDVYAKYMKELNDLRKEYMPKKPDVKPGEGKANPMPTDAEVDKMMRDRFKQSRKMLDIREKYYDEFRKFLSPKQVQKVYDKGMMNRGKFHQEMNRRAGMKRMDAAKAGNRGV
jgi:Spy/CpxP family protein refolding chaperone